MIISDWKQWSSLALQERDQLPTQPGLYIIADQEDQVWYVGQSKNLYNRWHGISHHRYKQLRRSDRKYFYRLYWKVFPVAELVSQEQFYINSLKPHLNFSRVKTYARKRTEPLQELQRILTVLNKQTLLFPRLRSLVLGQYQEIGEDETGGLFTHNLTVITVHINDHNNIILKSCDKSLSRKGAKLKGHWLLYYPDDNVMGDNSSFNIPVFCLNESVYIFMPCPDLVHHYEQHPSSYQSAQLLDRPVSSVISVAELASVTTQLLDPDNRTFARRELQYLHSRIPDLQPLVRSTD